MHICCTDGQDCIHESLSDPWGLIKYNYCFFYHLTRHSLNIWIHTTTVSKVGVVNHNNRVGNYQ